jgi:hypothetical protein
MSDRFSRSSTKYGPSVTDGVTTQLAFVDPGVVVADGDVGADDEEVPSLQPTTPSAINDPSE